MGFCTGAAVCTAALGETMGAQAEITSEATSNKPNTINNLFIFLLQNILAIAILLTKVYCFCSQ
jgi:hypothetical protein